MTTRKRPRRETQPAELTPSRDRHENVVVSSPTPKRRRAVKSSSAKGRTAFASSNPDTPKSPSERAKRSKPTTSSEDNSVDVNCGARAKQIPLKSEVKLEGKEEPSAIKEETLASRKGAEAAGTEVSKTVPAGQGQRKKRKTKEERAAEAMPLAARALNGPLKLGAHVSAAGGVHNAVTNAIHIGANAFALFLKSQRKWDNPALKDEVRAAFHDGCKHHAYDANAHCVPHGSYLVNLAAEAKEKADQAYAGFLDDAQRCEKLGIRLYNFHPGNTNGRPRAEAIARIANQLNRAHKTTKSVVFLLENMASAADANTIGGRFEDLRDTIALVKDKSRVGVCFDTCHAFAAGYDLRTPEALKATLDEFERVIGKRYLKAVHLNDSKGMFRSNRDLHQNIGLGFLGLRAFHALVNEPLFHGIPLVLETPCDFKDSNGKSVEDQGIWAREIKMLESLVGMDPDGKEFKQLEQELQDKGAPERQKLQAQFEKKQNSPKKKRGPAKAKDTDISEDDD